MSNLNNNDSLFSLFSLVGLLINLGGDFKVKETSPDHYEIEEVWSPSGSDWDNVYIPRASGSLKDVISQTREMVKSTVAYKRKEILSSLDWRRSSHFADSCNNQAEWEAIIVDYEKYLADFDERYKDFL